MLESSFASRLATMGRREACAHGASARRAPAVSRLPRPVAMSEALSRRGHLMAWSVILASMLAGCSARTRRTPDDALVYVLELQVRELDPRYVVTNHETKISRLVAPALISVDQPS